MLTDKLGLLSREARCSPVISTLYPCKTSGDSSHCVQTSVSTISRLEIHTSMETRINELTVHSQPHCPSDSVTTERKNGIEDDVSDGEVFTDGECEPRRWSEASSPEDFSTAINSSVESFSSLTISSMGNSEASSTVNCDSADAETNCPGVDPQLTDTIGIPYADDSCTVTKMHTVAAFGSEEGHSAFRMSGTVYRQSLSRRSAAKRHTVSYPSTPETFRAKKSILRMSKSESDLTVSSKSVSFSDPLVSGHFEIPARIRKASHSPPSRFSNRQSSLRQQHLLLLSLPSPCAAAANTIPLQHRRYSLDQEQPRLCADFSIQLSRNHVRLSAMTNRDNKLLAYVCVTNVCLEKTVFIRLTRDSWNTHRDVPASYSHSISGDVDEFEAEFILDGPTHRHSKVEFAVCFQTADGRSYWDNNYGKNYQIS